VSEMAQRYMEEDGIAFLLSSKIEQVSNQDEQVVVRASGTDYIFDAVLYATGRKPNTATLGLEDTGIKVTERGAIQVDDYCETSVAGVYAVGDVNGG
ncbi:FAD-dependent oxidoreductase, partial [Streptococcus pyogenes]